MGLVVLLVSAASEQVSLGPRSALALAELGVTSVSLVGGEETVGVVVEGWAFDPARINEAVRAMFPDATADIRIFHEIERVAVSAVSAERRG